MIEVEGLVFEYPGVRALDGVSFTLPAGSIAALVGPNGAGKSTLMRCIAGLETPLSGRVRLGQVEVQAEVRRSHRLIGFLSDFFGLYDDLTMERCLLHRAGAMGIAGAERPGRVAEVSARCGIADLMQRRAGELSRGQRQRLAIAQALVHGPQVLLLDEPASGLDPSARAALSRLLRRLRGEGLTMIVSSHILSELEDYSTHMLALDRGKVLTHRAMEPAAGAAERVAVTLRLAEADERLEGLLEAAEGVTGLDPRAREARFSMAGDEAARAALLAHLVGQGLKVSAFQVEAETMERAYLGLIENTSGNKASAEPASVEEARE